MREQRGGNEKAVEDCKGHRHAFPSPVAPRRNRRENSQQSNSNRDPGPHSEKSQPRADTDEFRDQSQKVSQHQIAHGEKSPEFAEAIENQFRMTAVCYGSQANRHLLNHEPHHEGENDERQKKSHTKARASR